MEKTTFRERVRMALSRTRAGRVLWNAARACRRRIRHEGIGATFYDRREVARILRRLEDPAMLYEKELLVLPRLVRPGSVVLDVGANLGIYTVALSRLAGPTGRVHSFEPGRRAFAQLRHMVELSGSRNVQLHNMAVGESEGTAQLSIPGHDLRFAHITREPEPSGTPTEVVNCTTLDAFIRDLQPGPISLLKCDCEGGEYAVFAGGIRLLEQKPTLIVEIAEPHCQRFGYTAADLFALLLGKRYAAFSFDAGRDRLVVCPQPTFDTIGKTWTPRDGYLGNNNYIFIHTDRLQDLEGLLDEPRKAVERRHPPG